ncbi:MAG TPA: polysaccharide deacetylase family protein [Kineosporiaceae bacterium]
MVTAQTLPAHRRPLLLRQAALGGFEDPGPRSLPAPDPVMRWGRPVLLPMSSVMRAVTTEPVISLTYDDGPNPDQTPALLDVLAERRARATFFVLTDRAEEHPEIVRRALAEGHEVELHGIDHARLTDVSGREAFRRIRLARRRLEGITGRPVRYYRPTYGAIGATAFVGVRALGLQTVIWSAWARDWSEAPAQEVADRVVGALHPGAVVLLHDTTDDAQALRTGPAPTFSRADVTRRVLDGMRAGGYTSVPVGELLRGRTAVRSVTVQRPRIPGRG